MCCCSLLIQPASIMRSIVIGLVFIAFHHPNNYEIVFTAPWRGYYSGNGGGNRLESIVLAGVGMSRKSGMAENMSKSSKNQINMQSKIYRRRIYLMG